MQVRDTASSPPSRATAPSWLWVLVILACACALRLYHLGIASLWVDEAETVWLVSKPLDEMWRILTTIELNPPLYSLLMHYWVASFGSSEFAVRLPSVLLGVASVFMLFRLGNSLFDRRTGLLAATLLAASPYHVAYSQEARCYSLLIFLSLWSCFVLAQLVRQPTRLRRGGYVLVTTAMLYTHPYAVFVVLAQVSAYLLALVSMRERPALGFWGGSALQLCLGLLYAPWIWVTVSSLRGLDKGNLWIAWYGWQIIGESYRDYAGGVALLTLLAALAANGVRRLGPRDFGLWLGIALSLCCVVVPVVMSRFGTPFYLVRYGIVALMGMCLLASAGIARRRWFAAITVGVLIALMLPAATHVEWTAGWRATDWRTVGETIRAQVAPRDAILVDNGYADYAVSYYLRRPDLYLPWGNRRKIEGLYLRDPLARIWIVLWNTATPPEDYLKRAGSYYTFARMEDHGGGCFLVELRPL